MDMGKFISNLTHTFGNNTGRTVHSKGIPALLEKLKAKEDYLQNQINSEKDEAKLSHQKLSLAVTKLQQTKAEKMLRN